MNRTDTFTRPNNASSLGTPSDGGSPWTAHVGTWGIALASKRRWLWLWVEQSEPSRGSEFVGGLERGWYRLFPCICFFAGRFQSLYAGPGAISG